MTGSQSSRYPFEGVKPGMRVKLLDTSGGEHTVTVTSVSPYTLYAAINEWDREQVVSVDILPLPTKPGLYRDSASQTMYLLRAWHRPLVVLSGFATAAAFIAAIWMGVTS